MSTTDVGFKDRVYCHKLLEAVMTVARDTLQTVLYWAIPDKGISQTMADYRNNLDQYTPSNYHNVNSRTRKFTIEEEDTLSKDPSCSKPGINLQYKIFKLFAHNVAKVDGYEWKPGDSCLESVFTKIKNFRNSVFHEYGQLSDKEYKEKKEELKELLQKVLEMGKQKYGRTDAELQEKIKEMEDGLTKVFYQVLGTEDLLTYDNQAIIKELVSEAKDHMKLVPTGVIDPLHFLPESGVRVKVPEIFCKMQVKKQDKQVCHKGHQSSGTVMDCKEILSIADPVSSQPQVLLTEGPAGSGKSILVDLVSHCWLDESQCLLKGLDKYQLILRMQCRDQHITSLDGLLRSALPKIYSKYANLMLPIIKNCNLLVLIDGVDEVNSESEKVLKNILDEFKASPKVTLLITSRPEGVTRFCTTLPSNYQVKNIDLLGIEEIDRIKVLMVYIKLFERFTGGTVVTTKLQTTLDLICKKDHYKLPLNLIFLAWQCVHDPISVTEADSQTQLYFWTHKLSVQKLIERLMNKPEFRNLETEKLEKCLEAIYLTLFEAIIHSQVILTEKDMKHIYSTCQANGIPPGEVLSTFFTKKTTRTPLGYKHQYSTPHKGLHDYYGALHIVFQLEQQPHSTIEEVIKGVLGPLPMVVKDFASILLHLAGLLHHHISTGLSRLQEELVQLLHKAGVESSEDEELCGWQKIGVYSWGEVVEGAQYSKGVIKAITRLLPRRDVMEVRDHVSGHSALLQEMDPTEVVVDISKPLPALTPLKDLLNHHTFSKVHLYHYYNNPQPTTTPDPFLQALLPRDGLLEFIGQWSGWMTRLPSTLKLLHISVTDDELVKTLLPVLHSLTHLETLSLHVGLTVTPAAIPTRLPDTEDGVDLQLTGLTDGEIDRACQLVARLQPKSKGYDRLWFPEACLSKEGWKRLQEAFIQLGIRVKGNVMVPKIPTTKDPELQTLYREKLICKSWEEKAIPATTRLLAPDTVMITGDDVAEKSALLLCMERTIVFVDIPGYPPSLSPLKAALTHHTFTRVFLDHHYFNPQPTTTQDPFLQALMSRDGLEYFSGQWSGWMTSLPSTLCNLSISVTENEQVKTLLPALHSLNNLRWLRVHIGLNVTPEGIINCLPDTKQYVDLLLPGLTESKIDQMCLLVSKLQPPSKGYDVLRFPKACLQKKGWKQLLKGFIRYGVRIKTGLKVPEDPTTEDPDLQTLYRKKLGCAFERDT